jgi:Flp pilus assembly protein TadD
MAAAEYKVRRDIYGADALAWTALKAGRLSEAQAAIKEALRLGTKDARLWYHAGMIARAAGDQAEAKKFLQQALQLSPHFDPLQSVAAEKALAE